MTDSTVVEWIEEYKETMISGGQQQTGMLNYDMHSCYRNLVYRRALRFPPPTLPPRITNYKVLCLAMSKLKFEHFHLCSNMDNGVP